LSRLPLDVPRSAACLLNRQRGRRAWAGPCLGLSRRVGTLPGSAGRRRSGRGYPARDRQLSVPAHHHL